MRIMVALASGLSIVAASVAAGAEDSSVAGKLKAIEAALQGLEGRLSFPTARYLADLEILADLEREARSRRSAAEAQRKQIRAELARDAESLARLVPNDQVEKVLAARALSAKATCEECDREIEEAGKQVEALRREQAATVARIQRQEFLQRSAITPDWSLAATGGLALEGLFMPEEEVSEPAPLSETERAAVRAFMDEVRTEARKQACSASSGAP